MRNPFDTATRMLKRRFSKKPIHRYWGEPNEICKYIIEGCFDREYGYFRVSSGHFREFYVRDFGMCVEALLSLGYTKQVIQTLAYALGRFEKFNKVTTTINAIGLPVNYFDFPTDSMPFLLRSLRLTQEHARGENKQAIDNLIKKYKPFLEHQAEVYCSEVFDFQKGMVKEDGKFSSIKDQEHRKSSTYDNCMAGMLSIELDKFKWRNPLHDIPIGNLLVKNRWLGFYFREDLSNNTRVCADANIFPFYCGLVGDLDMLKRCIKSISRVGLDRPFPIKYTADNSMKNKNMAGWLAPNYEGNTIWVHLGFCYLYVLDKVYPEQVKAHVETYFNNIKQFGNFLEVYTPDGRAPYKNPFYISDESILWAAMYLQLAKKHKVQ